ncbi:hypothetical protein HDV01_005430 [Terramyces sp. JEL0728]|nr:hypothetical protein HDV01_005430 [Terramyces sp. JEL0728]
MLAIAILLSVINALVYPRYSTVTSSPSLYQPITKETVPFLSNFAFTTNSIYNLIGAVLFIAIGLFLLFYGYETFEVMLFVVGGLVFALVAFIVLNTMQYRNVVSFGNPDMWYFVILGISAIIGGFIILCTWNVGVYCVALLFGYIVSSTALQFAQFPLSDMILRAVFIAAVCIFFIILTVKFKTVILIVGTSFIGSLIFVLGVDFFVHSGFGLWLYRSIDLNQVGALSQSGYYLMVGFAVLGILGSTYQYNKMRDNFEPIDK